MLLQHGGESDSSATFFELNEELSAARRALLHFAEAEGVLESVLTDPSFPENRYSSIAGVRAFVTVSELLRVVARAPEPEDERQDEEATAVYASLLQLAEVFDILIDQHSLVYGDAVALAEGMQDGWLAMGGCPTRGACLEDAAGVCGRMRENLAPTGTLVEQLESLPAASREQAVARLREVEGEPWMREARYLALRAVDACVPADALDGRVARALEGLRRPPEHLTNVNDREALSVAMGDAVLASLVRGCSRAFVSAALERPFAALAPVH
ncbi:MAG TPA: hypothetical protein VF167_16860 [Longimicrobiaceae bacterium]